MTPVVGLVEISLTLRALVKAFEISLSCASVLIVIVFGKESEEFQGEFSLYVTVESYKDVVELPKEVPGSMD